MKNAVLGSLLLASGSLVGCTVTTLEPGTISMDITLTSAGGGAVGAAQPSDAIRLNAIPVGFGGAPTSNLFNPVGGVYETLTLDGDDYDVWADYVNDNGTPSNVADDFIVGTTSVVEVTVDGVLTPDLVVDLDLDKGFYSMEYQITDGGAPVNCGVVVDQNGISLVATIAGTTYGEDTIYNCDDGAFFSDPFPLGPSVISVSVLNSEDLALGTSAPINAELEEGNDYEDLGTVQIPLD